MFFFITYQAKSNLQFTTIDMWVPVCGISLTLINLRTRTSAGSAALSGFAQGVGYILASLGPLLFGWLWDLGGSLTLPLIFLVVALVVLCTSAWIACQPRMLEDELEPASPANS